MWIIPKPYSTSKTLRLREIQAVRYHKPQRCISYNCTAVPFVGSWQLCGSRHIATEGVLPLKLRSVPCLIPLKAVCYTYMANEGLKNQCSHPRLYSPQTITGSQPCGSPTTSTCCLLLNALMEKLNLVLILDLQQPQHSQ